MVYFKKTYIGGKMKTKRVLLAALTSLLIVGMCISVYASAQGTIRSRDAHVYVYGGVEFSNGFLMRDLVTYYGGMYGNDMEQLAQNIPGVDPVSGCIIVGTDQKGYDEVRKHDLSYVDDERKHIINTTSVKCGYRGKEAVMRMIIYSGSAISSSLTIKSS